MFESAELGHRVEKRDYAEKLPELRQELLLAQLRAVERAEFPVVVLVGGVDGGGKGDMVNLLLEWMDPRHIHVHAMGEPSDEERARPVMWRYWRALPPKGEMGIFFGSWYTAPIVDRVYGRVRGGVFDRALGEIGRFEKMLVDEGALIIKLWMHLSKKDQKKRFHELESDRTTRWRVTDEDWDDHSRYKQFRTVSERALRETSTADAPWIVVGARDDRYRNLTVGRALLEAIQKRLDRRKRVSVLGPTAPAEKAIDKRDVIAALDRKKTLSVAEYDRRLPELQARLNALSRHKRFADHACVVVFEGNDAAGKGGAVRRVTGALDARRYDVVPIAAPTQEERAQPYLWRFWRSVPKLGHFALFDRSWYGRVLVERVEGLTAEADWMRAYGEIVDFEESLGRFGIVVVKLWMAVSKEEQLARFRDREKTSFKRFKITADDWRNRKKWDDYQRAVCDMVDRTSVASAPWVLVEANDKRWARVKVLETVCGAVERVL